MALVVTWERFRLTLCSDPVPCLLARNGLPGARLATERCADFDPRAKHRLLALGTHRHKYRKTRVKRRTFFAPKFTWKVGVPLSLTFEIPILYAKEMGVTKTRVRFACG